MFFKRKKEVFARIPTQSGNEFYQGIESVSEPTVRVYGANGELEGTRPAQEVPRPANAAEARAAMPPNAAERRDRAEALAQRRAIMAISAAEARAKAATAANHGRVRSAVVEVTPRSKTLANDAAAGILPRGGSSATPAPAAPAAPASPSASAGYSGRYRGRSSASVSATVESLIREIQSETEAAERKAAAAERRAILQENPTPATPDTATALMSANVAAATIPTAPLERESDDEEPGFRKYEGRFAHIGETRSVREQSAGVTQELPPIEEEVKVHGRQLSTATAYDELINWSSRLTKEIPLFQRALSLANAKSIVEVGCGSGRHSIMFGEWGYQVLGIDSNPQSIARANARLEEAEPQLAESRGEVSFAQGEFGEVAKLVGPEKTEIIFCLGDTLPRVGSLTALREALADFANALRSNGVLVLEFTNHIHFSQQRIRYSTPAVFDTVEGTKVFLRLMEFPAANTIVDVDFITLTKGDDGDWKVQSEKSQEVFISPTGIARELLDAGFDVMETAGDYNGRELNQYEDERITVITRRRRYRPAL